MSHSWQHAWLAAAGTLLAALAPSLGGEWCEDFESGSGTFWKQSEYQGGKWQHTTYTDETAKGHDVPKPPTGEDGMLLLRPYEYSIVAWSMLVSPEMRFTDDASIQLDYWLWFNRTQPHTPVSFMLFRLQVAIYGFMAGDGPVMTSNIGLDRVILRGVDGHNPCGGNSTVPPTPTPPPTTPMTKPTAPPTSGPTTQPYDFFCPTQYGLYRDPYNCSYFYSCSNWRAYHMACPTNLVYNEATERCDYRKNVPGC